RPGWRGQSNLIGTGRPRRPAGCMKERLGKARARRVKDRAGAREPMRPKSAGAIHLWRAPGQKARCHKLPRTHRGMTKRTAHIPSAAGPLNQSMVAYLIKPEAGD